MNKRIKGLFALIFLLLLITLLAINWNTLTQSHSSALKTQTDWDNEVTILKQQHPQYSDAQIAEILIGEQNVENASKAMNDKSDRDTKWIIISIIAVVLLGFGIVSLIQYQRSKKRKQLN